jgi:hypothetical protein
VFKFADFHSFLLQDVLAGFRHATEHMICEAGEEIADWASPLYSQAREFYGERELLLHKRMWDILTRDKAGRPKEQSFSEWCRRVEKHSETISTSRGHVEADSTAIEHDADSTATEHANRLLPSEHWLTIF